ncbi:uncharacterized protein Dmul_35220 [Desulfococcus multivorans]|jgi:hypothetical protein|nr:uncharacterized protein Dmul_35220 [Desulfococcus multivorans]
MLQEREPLHLSLLTRKFKLFLAMTGLKAGPGILMPFLTYLKTFGKQDFGELFRRGFQIGFNLLLKKNMVRFINDRCKHP